MTYRDATISDPPRGWVELVWRWLQQRREDRRALALDAPRKLRATYMQRTNPAYAYEAMTVVVSSCPGRAITTPPNPNDRETVVYYLCTAGNCCCEVVK